MYKKIIFILLFSLTLGLVFAGGDSESDKTSIVVWTDQTQTERFAQIRLLLDTFEALNADKNYEVDLVAVDINEITQQMSTAVSSGTTPNVLHTTTQFLLALDEEDLIDTDANKEILQDLNSSRFFQGAVDFSKSSRNNGYFMIPFHFTVQGIWYRQDWFDEAGLAIPNNYDALLAAAKYFYKPEMNQYGLLLGTKAQEQYNEQNFLHIATANDAYLFDRQGNLNIDSPEMIEAMEYYRELSKYTPPGPQTWRSRDYYLQGKLAMFFYSSFIMDDLALQEVAANSLTSENFSELGGAEFDKNLVNNTKIAPAFKWKTTSTYAEMNGLTVLKDDDAKTEAAKELIEFLFEADNYISWIHIAPGGMLPVLKEVAQSDAFLDDPKGVYSRYGKEKILDLVSGINNVKSFVIRDGVIYPQAATVASKLILPDMLYEITEVGTPIATAVADAKEKIEDLLN